MKKRISWFLLLWTGYLLLIINNWKNIKYFGHLVKELQKLLKNNSKYIEDAGWILVRKEKIKNL